jgi:hypothetical protein
MRQIRRHSRTAVLAALLLVALTGCGAAAQDPEVATARSDTSGDAGGSADPAADIPDEERMRAFASCMREHGVDMPDPQPGGPVRIGGGPGAGDRDTMEQAMQACRALMPNGGKPPQLSPEDLEKARAMAACMREHGVDVPDPDPANGGGVVMRRDSADGRPPVDDGTLEKAVQACRHLGPRPSGGSDDGGPRLSTGGPGSSGAGGSTGGSGGSTDGSGGPDGSSDGSAGGGG